MRACQNERMNVLQYSSKEPAFSVICSKGTYSLVAVWETASTPFVSQKRIKDMVQNYHKQFKKFLYNYKARTDKSFCKEKLKKFQLQAKNLFDIAACKCSDLTSCQCPVVKKVPRKEHTFLLDHRSDRKMCVSGIDRKESIKIQKRLHRKRKLEKNEAAHSQTSAATVSLSDCDEHDADTHISSEESNVSDFEEESFQSNMQASSNVARKNLHLSRVAQACDRTRVFDKTAANITSSPLIDLGKVTKDDYSSVVDRHKICRNRQKVHKNLKQKDTLAALQKEPYAIFLMNE